MPEDELTLSQKFMKGLENNDPDAAIIATKTLAQTYRNVFGSPEGKEVLNHILIGLGMFDPLPHNDTPALERYNVAMALLRQLWIGQTDEEKGEAIQAIINAVPLFREGTNLDNAGKTAKE
jgi:hypothetical protein